MCMFRWNNRSLIFDAINIDYKLYKFSEMEISVWYTVDQIFTSSAATKPNVREKMQIRSLNALPGPYWELTEPLTSPRSSGDTWLPL